MEKHKMLLPIRHGYHSILCRTMLANNKEITVSSLANTGAVENRTMGCEKTYNEVERQKAVDCKTRRSVF
jgi:hypothetical protein